MEIEAGQWIVVATTVVIVLIAGVFHFEVLTLLNRWVTRRLHDSMPGHRPRYVLLVVMFALLVAHVLQIWLFAAGFWLLTRSATDAFGAVVGYERFTFLDYVYFSVTNYTTVGWGDLHAVGPLRFLAGTESLSGLLAITWSASFTYLMMARAWRDGETGDS
jgi:hypothetical protein